MRLAIETDTPIVPVAVIGGEEQYISVANVERARQAPPHAGFPVMPQLLLPGGQLPLPTKYRIYFGEPMRFDGDPDDDDAVIEEKVWLVKADRAVDDQSRREGAPARILVTTDGEPRCPIAPRRVPQGPGTVRLACPGLQAEPGRHHRRLRSARQEPRATPAPRAHRGGRRPAPVPRQAQGRRAQAQLDIRRTKLKDVFRLGQVQAVVHLGVMHDPRASAAEHHSWNVAGFVKLLEYVAQFEVKKLVVLSSANVYGPQPGNAQFLTEEAPLLGGQNFSEIRDLIEVDMLAQSFFWKRPETETVILRPVHILGAVRNAPSNFLRLPAIPTAIGFDPMVQVIHEADVV